MTCSTVQPEKWALDEGVPSVHVLKRCPTTVHEPRAGNMELKGFQSQHSLGQNNGNLLLACPTKACLKPRFLENTSKHCRCMCGLCVTGLHWPAFTFHGISRNTHKKNRGSGIAETIYTQCFPSNSWCLYSIVIVVPSSFADLGCFLLSINIYCQNVLRCPCKIASNCRNTAVTGCSISVLVIIGGMDPWIKWNKLTYSH